MSVKLTITRLCAEGLIFKTVWSRVRHMGSTACKLAHERRPEVLRFRVATVSHIADVSISRSPMASRDCDPQQMTNREGSTVWSADGVLHAHSKAARPKPQLANHEISQTHTTYREPGCRNPCRSLGRSVGHVALLFLAVEANPTRVSITSLVD